ncbi:MAG TPA: LysM domain-containing protein [Candidatus Limnocylindria bacterium]|nr:LysM domain-containing protein [Candidatus Limnocylindria bacterium]
MTERGLPIVDGAPACPFVAFEDDRDERAASPDHRHRCYAEANPAPRALAHQEAYCLSSAFPVCPTFQDWARREAARSRAEAAPGPTRGELEALVAPMNPQRNPPRNWAAPPPWSGRRGEQRPDADWEDDEGNGDRPADPDVPRRGRGLSGSYADRVAADRLVVPGMDEDDHDDELDAGSSGASMAGGAAALAGPTAGTFEPSKGPLAARSDPAAPSYRAPNDWSEDDDDDEALPPAPARRRERDPDRLAAFGGGSRPAGGRDAAREPSRADRRSDVDGGPRRDGGGERRSGRREDAPEWERARPLEAYPTLRSRRLPELSIPPILVAVVALALAAAVLFALPGLLGFGNPSTGGKSPSPSTPIRTPLVTAAPTPIPQPTQQLYVVAPGDTMSKIAGRFGIALADLIAANAENIPNPDTLQIGDQVIIPAQATPSELPAASEIPAAP